MLSLPRNVPEWDVDWISVEAFSVESERYMERAEPVSGRSEDLRRELVFWWKLEDTAARRRVFHAKN